MLPVPVPRDTDELLSVTTVRDGLPSRVVVVVVGEIDAYTAPALDVCLQSQSRQQGVRELVVDLADVTFLAAAGIRVLARTARRCRIRGARLVLLTGGRRAALRPLQMTALADRVAVDPARHLRAGRRVRDRRRSAPRRPAAGGGRRVEQ